MFSFCIARGQTDSNTYLVKSLDGKNCSINVYNDWDKRQLRIVYGRNTLHFIDNWYGEVKATLLNPSFLKIIYSRRGGSNAQINDLLLICVQNGKPYVALNVSSDSRFETGSNLEEMVSKVKLRNKTGGNFNLTLSVHYMRHFEHEPQENYSIATVLIFDKKNNIFTNNLTRLDGFFLVDNYQSKPRKVHFHSVYPAINTAHQNYYFISGEWYRDFIEFPGWKGTNAKRRLYRNMMR